MLQRSPLKHYHLPISMIDRSKIEVFGSFEAADEADKLARWSMTSDERLEAVEMLRRYRYPDGKTAPRLQRFFESAELEKG